MKHPHTIMRGDEFDQIWLNGKLRAVGDTVMMTEAEAKYLVRNGTLSKDVIETNAVVVDHQPIEVQGTEPVEITTRDPLDHDGDGRKGGIARRRPRR